jgi:maltooligosyltrehalose trehalohydrolase
LARCLSEGFIYQGEASSHRNGESRGTISKDLPPTAFVLFLQNHDQIGNRAFGDRLTTSAKSDAIETAAALQLLAPQIPLIFMGEEDASRSPFQFFTDHHGELAEAVREGRRKEFAGFAAFSDPAKRSTIPDPNAAETFERSRPQPDAEQGPSRRALYQRLLSLRRKHLVPRLCGAKAIGAEVIGPAAVSASWRLGDGATYAIATNLGGEPCAFRPPAGDQIYGAPATGTLQGYSTLVFLESARG